MKFHRLISALALVLFVTCLVGIARAQTPPWDTNIITWPTITQCTTGEPVSACPVTGYRIEQSATATGTFTPLTTITNPATLSFTVTGVTAGQHCYRGFVQWASGDGPVSNVICKTNTKPVGPPNPMQLTVAQNQAFGVVYDKRAKHYNVSSQFGTATVGAECKTDPVLGDGYYSLVHPILDSKPWPGFKRTKIVAAQCAEA